MHREIAIKPDRRSCLFDGAGRRAVAIAVPLKDEAAHIPAMLAALDEAACCYGALVTVVVVANDCVDASVALLESYVPRHIDLDWRAVSMLPGACHAGWARRLALDVAADHLSRPGDLLLSTDADTLVSPQWLRRIVGYVDEGFDAVAGHALTRAEERRRLGVKAKNRLDRIGRYYTALAYLQAAAEPVPDDPWPRHFYEGGASIALTLAMYRRIGGAPTPSLAEDKALFDRVRAHGGKVRHPVDVRVFTSCRTQGRAPGGMADALAQWIVQPEDAPLHELYNVAASLGGNATGADRISFDTLGKAQAEAQRRIRAMRQPSNAPPQIEPVLVVPFSSDDRHRLVQVAAKSIDGGVSAERIIGLTKPVDEQEVAA